MDSVYDCDNFISRNNVTNVNQIDNQTDKERKIQHFKQAIDEKYEQILCSKSTMYSFDFEKERPFGFSCENTTGWESKGNKWIGKMTMSYDTITDIKDCLDDDHKKIKFHSDPMSNNSNLTIPSKSKSNLMINVSNKPPINLNIPQNKQYFEKLFAKAKKTYKFLKLQYKDL